MVLITNQEHHERINRALSAKHRISFDPIPQARHRVALNSRMHLYDPSCEKKRSLKAAVINHLSNSFGISFDDFPLTNSYVTVDVTFIISRPDCHFVGDDRDGGVLPNYAHAMPTVQGDIDNFASFFSMQ